MNKIFDIGRPTAPQQKPPKTPRNRKKLSQLFFVLIVVLVLVLISLSRTKSNKVSGDTTIPKDITTTESIPTTSSATPTKTPTTQKSNSSSSANTPEIDKSKISIKILNGSGQSGLAADTKTMLEKDGFVVSETGTAKNTYNNTTIYYNQNKEAQAMLLAGYFTQDVLSENNPDLTGQFDILIVVGKK